MLDDNRPTLTLTHPQANANPSLTRILIGMHDYDTGLDMDSFTVTADFAIDGVAPGQNLAARFKSVGQGILEYRLAQASVRNRLPLAARSSRDRPKRNLWLESRGVVSGKEAHHSLLTPHPPRSVPSCRTNCPTW